MKRNKRVKSEYEVQLAKKIKSVNLHCKEMNKIFDRRNENFIDELNAVMDKVFALGGDLYWDRELYIDCNCNNEEAQKLVRTSENIMFKPNDDPTEHLGIVVCYKNKKR